MEFLVELDVTSTGLFSICMWFLFPVLLRCNSLCCVALRCVAIRCVVSIELHCVLLHCDPLHCVAL